MFLHAHGLTSHPFACREPRHPRPGVGKSLQPTSPPALGSLRAPSRATLGAPRYERARKMRLSDVCNQPTIRAPCGLLDSLAPVRARGWRASLDGGLQLRLPSMTSRDLSFVELSRTGRALASPSSLCEHASGAYTPRRRRVEKSAVGPGGCCGRQTLRRSLPGSGVFDRVTGSRHGL